MLSRAPGERLHRVGEQFAAVHRRMAPRRVERRRQQRVRARRLGERHRAIDLVLVDQVLGAMPEVEHRRLGEAPDDLVRARDHEVRAGRQCMLGELLVEGEVRAPGLVDDQRDPAGVGDGRERCDVGDRPEVGRGDDPRADGPGGGGERALERLRGAGSARSRAPGRSPARRTSGRSPERISASIVLECALRCTTTSPPRCASASPAARLPCEAPLIRNQARLAPHASAASRWACSNGVGSAPTSMPWVSAGMSRLRARSPIASSSSGSAPGPPLCPGTCSRAGSRAAYSRSACR